LLLNQIAEAKSQHHPAPVSGRHNRKIGIITDRKLILTGFFIIFMPDRGF
jgi:hypothetical protein